MKAYKYLMVYEIWGEGMFTGRGTCEVLLRKRISSKEEIEEAEARILVNSGKGEGHTAMVINYILMDEVEYEEGSRV